MYWKRLKLNKGLRKVLDLYIGLTKKGKQVMNVLLAILYLIGGMFGMMLSFYMLLLFIQWVADVIDEKRWKDWRYWFES